MQATKDRRADVTAASHCSQPRLAHQWRGRHTPSIGRAIARSSGPRLSSRQAGFSILEGVEETWNIPQSNLARARRWLPREVPKGFLISNYCPICIGPYRAYRCMSLICID